MKRTQSAWASWFWVAAAIVTCNCLAQTAPHPWTGFRVGSWAAYRTRSVGGSGPETLTRFELTALSATSATVKIEVDANGQTASQEAHYAIPWNHTESAASAEETLEIGGRKLKCHVVVYPEEGVKIWKCDAVPGFMVQTETKKTITTLFDFEAK
jgi:hypothetical protein